MLPRDPYDRARVRMLEDTTDQYLYTALREVRAAQFEYTPPFLVRKKAEEIDHRGLEAGKAKVHQHLARLEAELTGRTYFGGDLFSLADAGLVPPLTASLPLYAILPDDRYPAIRAWVQRVSSRPSVSASAPKVPLRIRD